MYLKKIEQKIGILLLAMITSSSLVCAQLGSIPVYNYSLYKVNIVVTTQNAMQAAIKPPQFSYTQLAIAPAPCNPDGSLQIHPVDTNYVQGANVPLGTVANVVFHDQATDFDLQIINAKGKVIRQINFGKSIGAIANADPARAIYVYSNVPLTQESAGDRGMVCYWDSNNPLQKPIVHYF